MLRPLDFGDFAHGNGEGMDIARAREVSAVGFVPEGRRSPDMARFLLEASLLGFINKHLEIKLHCNVTAHQNKGYVDYIGEWQLIDFGYTTKVCSLFTKPLARFRATSGYTHH